jgi:phosphatidylserine/phosphatidylglycerophosphate/cardiolipin synthase-like enzyme
MFRRIKRKPLPQKDLNWKDKRDYCWSTNTWQGRTLQAIVLSETPLTFEELKGKTSYGEIKLNKALGDLIACQTIFKIENNDQSQVKYQICDDLRPSFFVHYKHLFDVEQEEKRERQRLEPEFPNWIENWKEAKSLHISEGDMHCFLEGRHLDDFSKEMISHASKQVLVANPFIQVCDLSNTLQDSKKKGTEVQIITRQPEDKYNRAEYLEKKRLYLQKLESQGIKVFYNPKVHAKLIIVDQAIAIASSMNFYPESSAGVSWEAGLVTWNKEIVYSITESFRKLTGNEAIENK